MTMLYSNSCHNEVCYKGTALQHCKGISERQFNYTIVIEHAGFSLPQKIPKIWLGLDFWGLYWESNENSTHSKIRQDWCI